MLFIKILYLSPNNFYKTKEYIFIQDVRFIFVTKKYIV